MFQRNYSDSVDCPISKTRITVTVLDCTPHSAASFLARFSTSFK